MKINQPKKSNSALKFIIPLLVVALIGALVYLALLNKGPSSEKPPKSPPTDSLQEQEKQIQDDAKTKQEYLDSQKPPDSNTSSPPTPPPTTTAQPKITMSTQQESDGTVTIFTKLYGISGGTCYLSVVNGSQNTSQTAQVIYAPEYSSCAGFSVNKSSLGSGTWHISLRVDQNGTQYNSEITANIS